MTGAISSAGKPTPIRAGGCPECGMGIQGAGTAEAQCGWCAWPDPEAYRERMARLRAKPRVSVRADVGEI